MSILEMAIQFQYDHVNFLSGVRLPHDSALEDQNKLAALSGPVETYYLETGGEHIGQVRSD